ncbi:MAG: hypothetical protein EB154_08685, partial [Nitrosopumilaceae archaeon]|nr:hypothetical protein [Nitrosopumilaceae archaeon]
YQLIQTKEECLSFIEILKSEKQYCFDTETSDLNTFTCKLVGLSFSFKKGTGYYVHLPQERNDALAILDLFQPVFSDERPGCFKFKHHIFVCMKAIMKEYVNLI